MKEEIFFLRGIELKDLRTFSFSRPSHVSDILFLSHRMYSLNCSIAFPKIVLLFPVPEELNSNFWDILVAGLMYL